VVVVVILAGEHAGSPLQNLRSSAVKEPGVCNTPLQQYFRGNVNNGISYSLA